MCSKVLSSSLETETTPKVMREFKKLKFQGRRAIPTTGYEQIQRLVHARLVIDAKEELTRVDAIKPSRTPAIGLESTEVTTRQSRSTLSFSGSAGFGSPSIKTMFSGHVGAESSSYLETRNYDHPGRQLQCHFVGVSAKAVSMIISLP